tara:strand:+ start:71 stop:823 length:753 start_codon:yes stop_codon:yes gene_type:complete
MANTIMLTITYPDTVSSDNSTESIPSDIKYLYDKVGESYCVGRASSDTTQGADIIISPKAGRSISRRHIIFSVNSLGNWQVEALTDFPTLVHEGYKRTNLSKGVNFTLPLNEMGEVECQIELGGGKCFLQLEPESTLRIEDVYRKPKTNKDLTNLAINGVNLLNEISGDYSRKLLLFLYSQPEGTYVSTEAVGNYLDSYGDKGEKKQRAKDAKSALSKQLKKINDIAEEFIDIESKPYSGYRLILSEGKR